MKKILTLMLVLAVAASMTTTVMAAQDTTEGNTYTTAADSEKSLIKVNINGNGQIAVSDDGSTPVFDDEKPVQSAAFNAKKGQTIIFSAKADEGNVFVGWIDSESKEILSASETFEINAEKPMDIIAVFEYPEDYVQIAANTEGQGQIAGAAEGEEPVFDDEYPAQSFAANVEKGSDVTLKAKADEGYVFVCWVDANKQEIISMEDTITVEVNKPTNLKAYFDLDVERVFLKINVDGPGQIASTSDGEEPVFDPQYPFQSFILSVVKGDTAAASAMPNDGAKFVGWKDNATGEIFSTDETIYIEMNEERDIIAVFEEADLTTPIKAEHTNITYDRNGDGLIIRTNSTADEVALRIDGGTIGTSSSLEGLDVENGTVTISKELVNDILKDGENHLRLVFVDGDVEIIVFVTDENAQNSDDTSKTVTPGTNTPKTGDTASAAAISAVLLGSAAAAVVLGKKRKNSEQE